MISNSKKVKDYPFPIASKWHVLQAVVDKKRGIIIAIADIFSSREQIYNAFTQKNIDLKNKE